MLRYKKDETFETKSSILYYIPINVVRIHINSYKLKSFPIYFIHILTLIVIQRKRSNNFCLYLFISERSTEDEIEENIKDIEDAIEKIIFPFNNIKINSYL